MDVLVQNVQVLSRRFPEKKLGEKKLLRSQILHPTTTSYYNPLILKRTEQKVAKNTHRTHQLSLFTLFLGSVQFFDEDITFFLENGQRLRY